LFPHFFNGLNLRVEKKNRGEMTNSCFLCREFDNKSCVEE